MSRWIIAQESQGAVESAWWAVIDTQMRGVRARVLGESLAASIADGLNAVESESESVQSLVDEILGSAPRACEHETTGDGSPVTTCPDCMTWVQALADAETVRQHFAQEARDGG